MHLHYFALHDFTSNNKLTLILIDWLILNGGIDTLDVQNQAHAGMLKAFCQLNKFFSSLSPCLGAALTCSSGDLSIVLSQATSWIHGETNICPVVLRGQGYVMTSACIELCRRYWIIRSPKNSFKMSRILEQLHQFYLYTRYILIINKCFLFLLFLMREANNDWIKLEDW